MGVREVDYIELRDYCVDPATGRRFDFATPCLVHTDHGRFLETLMSRVDSEGVVDMKGWMTPPIEAAQITDLSVEQATELRAHLAQMLFQAARHAADLRHNRELVVSHEGFVASILAPYRDHHDFLGEVVKMADAAAAWWQPSVI